MINRVDPDSAAATFAAFYPDPRVRQLCVQAMAESALTAHAAAPNDWGITLFGNLVRLNVGTIEVLSLLPDIAHFILDTESLPEALKQRADVQLLFESSLTRQRRGFYPSVPISVACDFHPQLASELFPILRSSHTTLIHAASSKRLNPAARSAYSPGVVEFLFRSTGQRLQHPLYHAHSQQPMA